MSLKVIKQGILDTIQDEGRFGYQHLGINPNGAMDLVAARIANMLAGNARGEAVIELHFPAACFQFATNCIVALSGADFHPSINDVRVDINCSLLVVAGSVLKFNHYNKGSRCYLAIHGGLGVDKWLESYSTNMKASVGGYQGRQLLKGDEIQLKKNNWKAPNSSSKTAAGYSPGLQTCSFYNASNIIRCTEGIEYNWLEEKFKTSLVETQFTILPQSDRMGYRLQGAMLQSTSAQLLSSAVVRGTIQLLPSGQLIVLMADHQTTGGYPKIAQVITADLPSLAQMRLNESIHFQLVSHEEAEQAYIDQQHQLNELQASIAGGIKQLIN
jgi:antagonist of KipI